MCLFAIGGIIKHAKAINAFTNPSTNSYKRLIPGFEAPVLLAYSARNRSASCRIPYTTNPKAKRVEVRFPDPTANPYLAYAALTMAAMDGIKTRSPGRPDGQGSLRPAAGRAEGHPDGVRFVARALESLAADHEFLLAGDVFSKEQIESYIELKWNEVYRFEHTARSSSRCTTPPDPVRIGRDERGLRASRGALFRGPWRDHNDGIAPCSCLPGEDDMKMCRRSRGWRMDIDEIGYLGVRELAALYRARKLSPVEVARAVLDRIERVDPQVNAMMRVTPEHAMAAARKSEAVFMQRDTPRLLEGVPVTIKDLQHTKGVQTDFGTAILQGTIPDVDAPCVSRMLSAGGLMMGKTTSAAEWGWKGVSQAPISGITHNPWGRGLNAGVVVRRRRCGGLRLWAAAPGGDGAGRSACRRISPACMG